MQIGGCFDEERPHPRESSLSDVTKAKQVSDQNECILNGAISDQQDRR